MDLAAAADRRAELYGLMGDLPARARPISATTVDREERDGYVLERLLVDRVDAELRRVYAAAGVPEAWRLIRYQTGHFETAAGRAEILTFLERQLG